MSDDDDRGRRTCPVDPEVARRRRQPKRPKLTLRGRHRRAHTERDELASTAQRVAGRLRELPQADAARADDGRSAADGRLVETLLPVLDELRARGRAASRARRRRRQGAQGRRARAIRRARRACWRRTASSAIAAIGEPFDPNEHEAVAQDDGDGEPVVGDVLRTGYRLKGRVLRPAMVKVVPYVESRRTRVTEA